MEEFWKFKESIILLPLLIGLFRYRKLDRPLKLIFYFVVFGTFIEICNQVLISAQFKNTFFIGHVYHVFAFVFLGLFYGDIFKRYVNRRIPLFIILLFIIYSVVNALFLQSINEYPSFQGAFLRFVFLITAIAFFYKTMVEAEIVNLSSEPLIWINFAILLYYAGGLFYSMLFNIILENSMELSLIMSRYFFGVLNAIFYILIAIGFYKAGKQKSGALNRI